MPSDLSPYLNRIICGDCLEVMRGMPDGSVQCCVTSPPYWGLRDYKLPPQIWDGDPECRHEWSTEIVHTEIGKGNWTQAYNGRGEVQGDIADFREPIRSTAETGFCKKCGARLGQFGLEPTPQLYIEHAVQIFREVHRVLKKDGTLWLNIGDSWTSGNRTHRRDPDSKNIPAIQSFDRLATPDGLKKKDLVGIPWRIAFALQNDGWYLRQDIIWNKPNCMPESAKDRCTKAHEYIFLLSKSERYYYDWKAIREKASPDTHARYARGRSGSHKWADGGPGNQTIAKSFEHMRVPSGWHQGSRAEGSAPRDRRKPGVTPKSSPAGSGIKNNDSFSHAVKDVVDNRNKRSVWTIPCSGFSEAHFATFPPKLIEPCILAGCPGGGIVLDPFMGSGTTGFVAQNLGRRWIGIELGTHYCHMAEERIKRETAQLNMFHPPLKQQEARA